MPELYLNMLPFLISWFDSKYVGNHHVCSAMEQDFGLIPLKVATWGPFVLINIDQKILPPQNSTKQTVGNAWLGSASEILSTNGIDSSLKHICRREYTIECNWKV